MRFNDHHNLTHEAEQEIRRFIDREFTSISVDLIKAAVGEDFDAIEQITSRTLICEECGEECEEGTEIEVEDEEFIVSDGETCPHCQNGAMEAQPDQGFPPMWSTLFQCSEWAAREVRQDPTIASGAGFEAYEFEDEIYLAIQGAGYNFYAPHWAPLWRSLFSDSPVENGDKLPGDPVECPECMGHGKADGDLLCPVCESSGKVPFVSFEQRREAQRERAIELLRRIVQFKRTYGIPDTITESAQEILDLTG